MNKTLINQLVRLLLLAATLVATFAQAQPFSCAPIKMIIQNQTLILPGPTQENTTQLYIFKNNASRGIWLDHPVKNASASAGWSSFLEAGNYSALILDRKNFSVTCAAINPGKVEYLNCSTVLSVCSMNTKPSKQKGTYWLAEDIKWDALKKKLETKPASTQSHP